METSDSDYFESADEDFYSEDESTPSKTVKAGVTECANQVETKNITHKVSTTDNSISNISKSDNQFNAKEVKQDSTDKHVKIVSSESDILDTRNKTITEEESNTTEKGKLAVSQSSKTEDSDEFTSSEIRLPNKKTNHKIIKEPSDINKDNDDSNIKAGIETILKGIHDLTNKVNSENDKAQKEKNMWEDDVEWDDIDKMITAETKCESTDNNPEPSKIMKVRPEFGVPPARVDCWEEGVNYINIIKPEPNKNVKVRPEFGIPPARVDCWEEGVNDIMPNKPDKNVIKQQKSEENMWNDDWAISSNPERGDCWEDGVNDIVSNNPATNLFKQEKPEENMWNNDDWEPLDAEDSNLPKQAVAKEDNNSWGGWGNWGLSSVISTATTLTSQVSQGLSTVLETGIGIPDPEELARQNKLEDDRIRETQPEESVQSKANNKLGFGLGNFVSGVTQITKLVETTGNKVITGGLDTLETIGKKTMEVLQENDPGLKKKRAFLKIDDEKPILSQILREAKEKAEEENKKLEEKIFSKKANYETLFDDHQGLVHLEALEMLSKQCDIKLQNLLDSSSGSTLIELQGTMSQIRELCELPDEDEDENFNALEIKEKLEDAVSEINVKITYDRLMSTWEEVSSWLKNINSNICNTRELHQQAIESLAQLTALSVEQFHKCGELLLVKHHRSTADEADSLVQITTTLTSLIGIAANKFTEKLNAFVTNGENKENVNELITNIFFEAANSSSYIQDAFHLLIPVLQVGAI